MQGDFVKYTKTINQRKKCTQDNLTSIKLSRLSFRPVNDKKSERHLESTVDKEHIHRQTRISHRHPRLQPQVLAVHQEAHTAASHGVEPEIAEGSPYCRGDRKKEREPNYSP